VEDLSQKHGMVIERIIPNSIAEEVDLASGDKVISINGKTIEDLIDYRYMIADDYLEVYIWKHNGEQVVYEIEKDYDEDLGIVFTGATCDGIRPCQNHCLFCFVDQMPRAMRSSLYVKDDDYRLSFIHGNFITLTNLSESELDRIISMHLSPLYISVHATDPFIREQLINNPAAGKILEQLKRLADSNILMHTQVVVCPGINDGEVLDKTISQLADLYPSIISLAVVPVGLTRFRDKLFKLNSFDKNSAKLLLKQMFNWQNKLLAKIKTRFVFPADEFYLLADWPIPPTAAYEGFPQLENGVGLARIFLDELEQCEGIIPQTIDRTKTVSLVHAASPAKIIAKLVNRLNQVENLTVFSYLIPHRFWGEKITVTGLLTGSDLVTELTGKPLGDTLYLPEVMIRKDTCLFLDDMTVDEVASLLNVKIVITSGVSELLQNIFEEDKK
jgi:putative radical SAM enzyme (TIGR03279 family)